MCSCQSSVRRGSCALRVCDRLPLGCPCASPCHCPHRCRVQYREPLLLQDVWEDELSDDDEQPAQVSGSNVEGVCACEAVLLPRPPCARAFEMLRPFRLGTPVARGLRQRPRERVHGLSFPPPCPWHSVCWWTGFGLLMSSCGHNANPQSPSVARQVPSNYDRTEGRGSGRQGCPTDSARDRGKRTGRPAFGSR